MSDNSIQSSFNVGEWAPTLNARVDITKYRSAAALLENFFVDYRGGASTRPGTEYILQAYKSATAVRLIPFQAAFSVGYVMEFGDFYIRFFFDGAPVLETAKSITSVAGGPPEVFTSTSHGYSNNDWLFVQGNYYIVQNSTSNSYTLTDLVAAPINTNPFTLPALTARVYTIISPFAAGDLALVKFAQNQNIMVLCHPNYQTQILTIISAANWTIQPIQIGSTVSPPTNVAVGTTLASGTVNYSYTVTAVDVTGQESAPGSPAALNGKTDLRSVAGTNSVSWNAVSGAASYNVYKSNVSYFGVISAGSPYGFIGNTQALNFDDSNIAADFSQTPPIPQNPFLGAGVLSITVTNNGGTGYNSGTVPTATVPTSASGQTAILQLILSTPSVALSSSTGGWPSTFVGVIRASTEVPSCQVQIVSINGFGVVTAISLVSPGQITAGTIPTSLTFDVGGGVKFIAIPQWRLTAINVISPGTGYTSVPAVTISNGTGAATAVLAPQSAGNPSVPGFFQQRLVLAAPSVASQTFYMSQPGNYFNFNISNPSLPTDAITGTLVSGQQNTIKSMVPQTSGLLMFSDKYSFLINGGSNGSAISPSATVANAQSYNGCSDVPLIQANFDVLYVQAKGSVIRDSAFNIYQNVFTGTDISVLSSHLFYGFSITEWGFAEEPFKLIQAIRNDGALLTLTFLKEQEFIGWTHSITQGNFKSVAVVTEQASTSSSVDGTYFVIERVVNGNTLKYIERLSNRQFPNGVEDAICVDAALVYDGTPQTNFSGAQHLAGLTVTGLADGVVIPPFVMPTSGAFTLTTAASKVSIGLGFTCDLQTLAIELGEPTVQGKVKKISGVDVRVADTLGLKIGQDFDHLTVMKDLVRGNVSTMLTGQAVQRVTDLVTGDAYTKISPAYTVPGQYCIRQDQPYPATILGVIPSITVGDSDK